MENSRVKNNVEQKYKAKNLDFTISKLLIKLIVNIGRAIDKFFVEVVYDGVHNVITEVRSFKYGRRLDKYSKL